MSLFGSLFSGVSGLTAQSQSMAMISDNVANVNTTAFKGALAQFSSLVTGQDNVATYSPGGVRTYTYQTIANQGLIQSTDSPTDVAISGGGFFVVNTAQDTSGEQLYTRAGSFAPDFVGDLRTPSGHYLQGWALDVNEQVVDVNTIETVNVNSINGVATATTSVEVGANLDADQLPFAGVYGGGDMALFNASGGTLGVQPDFSREIQIYDSLGRPQNITMAFLRDAAPNSWNVEIYGDAAEVDAVSHPNGLLASGAITFNGDGSLGTTNIVPVISGIANAPVDIDWAAATGANPSAVTMDFGNPGQTDGLTQFASPTNVAFVTQNGAEVGELSGVSIDEEGYVVAAFTNGEQRRLYLLPISTFANPIALDPRTGNVYAQTDNSGEFNLRVAGSGGAGTLATAALESANVDLADEFTKMIVTQRAYSANARVITTTNDMLSELIQMNR